MYGGLRNGVVILANVGQKNFYDDLEDYLRGKGYLEKDELQQDRLLLLVKRVTPRTKSVKQYDQLVQHEKEYGHQ